MLNLEKFSGEVGGNGFVLAGLNLGNNGLAAWIDYHRCLLYTITNSIPTVQLLLFSHSWCADSSSTTRKLVTSGKRIRQFQMPYPKWEVCLMSVNTKFAGKARGREREKAVVSTKPSPLQILLWPWTWWRGRLQMFFPWLLLEAGSTGPSLGFWPVSVSGHSFYPTETISVWLTAKVPFPLTYRFKAMLQRGVELQSLSTSW